MVAGMQTHTTPTTNGRLLTADDVAGVLGVPRTFVYTLARRGELPTVRVGERYVRFRTQALDQWIEQQETSRHRGLR
jgi:excisionase family DNA binding protein